MATASLAANRFSEPASAGAAAGRPMVTAYWTDGVGAAVVTTVSAKVGSDAAKLTPSRAVHLLIMLIFICFGLFDYF